RPRPPAAADRGRRAAGLGDPRVMALFQAICAFTHLPRGFRNRNLRAQVEPLWGRPYSATQMTYDLRRLRLKGLIQRIPNTHRCTATSYGLKVAFFYAKLYLRIFRPSWPALLAEDDPFPSLLRPPSTASIAKSKSCTRRLHLLPEKTCFNPYDHLLWRCLAATRD